MTPFDFSHHHHVGFDQRRTNKAHDGSVYQPLQVLASRGWWALGKALGTAIIGAGAIYALMLVLP